MENCKKCNGSGKLDRFRGFANGVCFLCGGSGQARIKTNNEPKFKVGDVIQKNYGGYEHKILKVTTKHYFTSEKSKLGRHIDKYPPGHKEEWLLVKEAGRV